MNQLINELYSRVFNSAIQYNNFGLPLNGIKNPDNENPINLFKRQINVEETSFRMSQAAYQKMIQSLIKINKID